MCTLTGAKMADSDAVDGGFVSKSADTAAGSVAKSAENVSIVSLCADRMNSTCKLSSGNGCSCVCFMPCLGCDLTVYCSVECTIVDSCCEIKCTLFNS